MAVISLVFGLLGYEHFAGHWVHIGDSLWQEGNRDEAVGDGSGRNCLGLDRAGICAGGMPATTGGGACSWD